MKKRVLLFIISLLNFSGCSFTLPSDFFKPIDKSENISSNDTSSESTSINSDSISNSSLSSEENDGPKVIDIYAINDFHGRILEDKTDKVPGISKLATYLKEQKSKDEDGYVFINSGDYWQDTYDSGTNKGELLTKCLDLMECEVMALGNHEFDWGTDVITYNKQFTEYTSFLGANIYNYPNTNEKSELGENYKIIERKGLKIGIIGAIGQEQITSITSSNWENLTFKDPTALIKQLSDELRTEKDCDIVILSIHAGEEDTNPKEITKTSSISKKKYVDAVFCAHTHQNEIKTYNGVPFIQGGEHGKYVSHIQLTYDEGDIITTYCKNDGYGKINYYQEDREINELIDSYFDEEYISKKNEVMGTITSSGGYISKNIAGRIQAKATYDRLVEIGYDDIDIVINNGGRSSVDSGQMTREKIFNMTPFTNYTYVVSNIKGQDIIDECVDYTNPYYIPNPNLELNANSYYTVACIDYMMLHKSTNRYYNYFKSYDSDNVEYILTEYPNEIIESFLHKNKTVNVYDFNTSNYTGLQS